MTVITCSSQPPILGLQNNKSSSTQYSSNSLTLITLISRKPHKSPPYVLDTTLLGVNLIIGNETVNLLLEKLY